jgi:hypothetical protein
VGLHQVGDAVRNHTRLTTARSGQQQERTVDMGDRSALLGIEGIEKIHENRSIKSLT